MKTHQCKGLKIQGKEIIYSDEEKGRIATIEIISYATFLKIFKRKIIEDLQIQFCPCCNKKIADYGY